MKSLIKEFFIFGFKQAYAAMFGGFLLLIMIITQYWYPFDGLHRYDFIFLSAIIFQIVLLSFKLETKREAFVIIVFHIIATFMELFKTSPNIASWTYPEQYNFGIATVPLFTGFLYSAIGSYLSRVWRIFDFKFYYYPKIIYTIILVIAIYLNFFLHHYFYDIRWILFIIIIILFYKTKVYFRIVTKRRHMPLLLGWFLVSFFIWIAENIGTFTRIWIYPSQTNTWQMVPFSKLLAWYLLMLLSFVLISLVNGIKYWNNNNSK